MIEKLISSVLALLLAIIPGVDSNISKTPNDQTTIVFTGDIMLGRSVMGESIDVHDNLYPFRKTNDFLKNADITFVNLENPVVKNCPRHKGGFKFCTTYDIAEGLKWSGVDVVTLANNHSNNYGSEGFEETKDYLANIGIKTVGYGNLEIVEDKGTKYGFLGFNYTFSTKDLEKDLEIIKKADSQVDVLIVGNHWGEEYRPTANSFQLMAAKRMVENGADVIIGHHPHWVQNYEEINGVPVYYSLGNFIFDQIWSEETKRGMVVKLTFKGKEIINREERNTYTTLIGQPEIVD